MNPYIAAFAGASIGSAFTALAYWLIAKYKSRGAGSGLSGSPELEEALEVHRGQLRDALSGFADSLAGEDTVVRAYLSLFEPRAGESR